MKTITEYKDMAIATLKGNWGTGALVTLIYFLVMVIPTAGLNAILENLGGIASLALLPLTWGFAVFFLRLVRRMQADFSNLFDGFKDYGRTFSTLLLVSVYTFLWSLLLVVPGIIKGYSYAMTSYVLADDPTMTGNAAIEKSMKMMQGHKAQLFLLDLSMIGWFVLSIITFGIGFLFLHPYLQTAHAHFYEDLKAQEQQAAPVQPEVAI